MKKITLLMGTLLCLLVATGCVNQTIKPEESKIGGDLAGAFKLVDEDYPVESSGNESSVTLKIKRTDVTVPYLPDKVGALGKEADDDLMVQGGFGYKLYDESGKEIEEVSAADNDAYKQVKQILALQPGEEGELTITFDSKLKAASVELTTKAKILSSGPLEFVGSIGKYGVKNFEAEFNFAKGEEKGKYQYVSSPAGSFLFFKGTNESYSLTSDQNVWKFSMTETNENGGWCGSYEGTLTLTREDEKSPYYYKMEGKFTNFRFDTYPYTISSKAIGSKTAKD